METDEFPILEEIDLDNLFYGLGNEKFDSEATFPTDDSSSPKNISSSSPVEVCLSVEEIQNILMEDDNVDPDPNQQSYDEFLANLFVDSPTPTYGSVDKDPSISASPPSTEEEDNKKDKDKAAEVKNDQEDLDDPISKKQRRQMRNRDAAVRSRERKKMYVKDLEMKTKYLEAECRRLGGLLQCCVAENQALRLGLKKENAFGVTSAKQESAVLLLESLLLGSLLWFLGIVCFFTQPLLLLQSSVMAVVPENMDRKVAEKGAPRGAGSKIFRSLVVGNGRRCKALRTRMKCGSNFVEVLVSL